MSGSKRGASTIFISSLIVLIMLGTPTGFSISSSISLDNTITIIDGSSHSLDLDNTGFSSKISSDMPGYEIVKSEGEYFCSGDSQSTLKITMNPGEIFSIYIICPEGDSFSFLGVVAHVKVWNNSYIQESGYLKAPPEEGGITSNSSEAWWIGTSIDEIGDDKSKGVTVEISAVHDAGMRLSIVFRS